MDSSCYPFLALRENSEKWRIGEDFKRWPGLTVAVSGWGYRPPAPVGARRHGGASHFLAQHTDYSHQKRDEAEFIDSEGVSADLANLVAATDTPIHLGGPNLRTGFGGLRHRGLNHSFIPLKRLSSVRGENLPKNL